MTGHLKHLKSVSAAYVEVRSRHQRPITFDGAIPWHYEPWHPPGSYPPGSIVEVACDRQTNALSDLLRTVWGPR